MAARDRLAQLRAQQQQQQQQQGGGNTFNGSSYPQQTNSGPGGYQARRPNPYAQQDEPPQYEMGHINGSHPTNFNAPADDMTAFYDEISQIQDKIREFNENVANIGNLHSRSLNTMDDAGVQRNQEQLENLVAETSAASAELKRRIKELEKKGGTGRDASIRQQQTNLVKSKFVEAIQNYQQVEQQYRSRYKQRMERQFKIVKPDASPEEVRAVVDNNQGDQIFSQALLNSNRYGESRAAYREVQERHEDIKKIERTLAELAQLFNDMSVLVERDQEVIDNIQTAAAGVEADTQAGLGYTEKARDSARSARRKRWICFFIILIILAIIGIVVGVVVSNNVKNNNNSGK